MKFRLSLLPAAMVLAYAPASADIVHLDDVIIDGSLCVGFDCVNGEAFGFDTIRLKENNVRIKFQDTSSSASFPTNDWQLTANDSANGGVNKFSIDDIDGSRTPFTVEAGARTNALYVESDGDVGFGTNNPVGDLHVVTGNTPTLRLEQDGSSGFQAQTWDVAGNETNFFIRDVTNGSKLPFRIRPNAPTSSIDIFSDRIVINDSGSNLDTRIESDTNQNLFFADASTDRIGIGTATPESTFHLVGDDGTSDRGIRLEGNVPTFRFSEADSVNQNWQIRTNNGDMFFQVNNDTFSSAQNRVILRDASTANVIELAGGAYSDGNDWFPASSRKLKKDIRELDATKATAAFEKLFPVEYTYKSSPDEPRVGFIAEDVPELVAHAERKGLSPLEITALITKVVQQQQQIISQHEKNITQLTDRLNRLENQ